MDRAFQIFRQLRSSRDMGDDCERMSSAASIADSRSEADIHLAQSWISVVLGIAVVVDTILATVLVVVFHRSRTGVEA